MSTVQGSRTVCLVVSFFSFEVVLKKLFHNTHAVPCHWICPYAEEGDLKGRAWVVARAS